MARIENTVGATTDIYNATRINSRYLVTKIRYVVIPEPIVLYFEIHTVPPDIVSVFVFRNLGNDNDNDTLREVPHLSNEGLALQARV